MKKRLALGLIAFIVVLSLLGLTACSSLGGKTTSTQQLVNVKRGDITLKVTGNGKIKAAREARLTFGSGGKVESIPVKEGDSVKAGDVLAKLDTKPLDLALSQAEMAVIQAETALAQAQVAKQSAEDNLENARNSKEPLNLALLNAKIAEDTARITLDASISSIDYYVVEAEYNKAKTYYEYVQKMLQIPGTDESTQALALDQAKERLDIAKANYDNMVAGYDSLQVSLKKKQLEAAELSVAIAQKNIEDLEKSLVLLDMQVNSAEQGVKQAQQAVGLAQMSRDDVRRQMEEATIYAPFEGIVAMVLAKEGDIVPSPSYAPQVIVQITDPGSLELLIDVDEIDIPLVEIGQTAVVEVEALQDSNISGQVTAIYPVPAEVGGIVLFKVRIGLDTTGVTGIKVGMSASADIVSEEHASVLLVPSRAIGKNDQGNTIVKIKSNNQVEDREIEVGLDDGLRAEVISGVNEGETVVVEVKVKSTSSMDLF
jgi:HlyD family secretion protein